MPLDVPYNQLSARQRRIVLHGTGDDWIKVYESRGDGRAAASHRTQFRFQFKGLYPALEEASRLSPRLRTQLEHLVDEIECSECGGSRLRDDASAVRFREKTLGEYSQLSLVQLLRRR